MNCIYCGQEIPLEAKFCPYCGKEAVVQGKITDTCVIECREVSYKWSLFGKFYYCFFACRTNGEIVLESDKMTLSGFEYSGPKETNSRHRKIFDEFVQKLEKDGWRRTDKAPIGWFGITFCKYGS